VRSGQSSWPASGGPVGPATAGPHDSTCS
jgi:hypothetical protein